MWEAIKLYTRTVLFTLPVAILNTAILFAVIMLTEGVWITVALIAIAVLAIRKIINDDRKENNHDQ